MIRVKLFAIKPQLINSLAPGRFWFNFRWVILKLTLVNGGWGISFEIALRWMPLDLTDDKSTLVQVMAWCRQATSHYLSQWWPRSMSPYGVIRPQWVNTTKYKFCAHILQNSILWYNLWQDICSGWQYSILNYTFFLQILAINFHRSCSSMFYVRITVWI